MSPSAPRRPSTLAARNFEAARQPLGAPAPAPRRPEADDMMGVGRTGLGRATVPSARLVSSALPMRTRPAPPPPAARRGLAAPETSGKPARPGATSDARSAGAEAVQRRVERQNKESVLITSLLVALVFVAVAIATLRLSGNLQVEASRKQLDGTFTRVFAQQGDFRLLNGRFATWPELHARGARLGPRQRVISSNASASHWFLSVRDTSTGIVCSRTGELFDESPGDRPPTCSPARR